MLSLNKPSYVVGFTISLIIVISGCAAIRKTTYPPDFKYLEAGQIETTMEKLAIGMVRLDRLLAESNNNSYPNRDEIIKELTLMEETSDSMGGGFTKTNHALIDSRVDAFKEDVKMARSAIEQEPPNYYLAGRLAGSCVACHTGR